MWYFAWILGITAAVAIGVINVMWYEAEDAFRGLDEKKNPEDPTRTH